MEFIENNPTTAALVGVALGALIGLAGTTVSARIAAKQAEKDRIQARRLDWLQRLAAAIAEIATIRGRLTATNIKWTKINEPLKLEAFESLEKQQDVRRELRAVGVLAGAGADTKVAESCVRAERCLSEFTKAAYGVFESVQGKEDPSVTEPRLTVADTALEQAITQLTHALSSLNSPSD